MFWLLNITYDMDCDGRSLCDCQADYLGLLWSNKKNKMLYFQNICDGSVLETFMIQQSSVFKVLTCHEFMTTLMMKKKEEAFKQKAF